MALGVEWPLQRRVLPASSTHAVVRHPGNTGSDFHPTKEYASTWVWSRLGVLCTTRGDSDDAWQSGLEHSMVPEHEGHLPSSGFALSDPKFDGCDGQEFQLLFQWPVGNDSSNDAAV